MGLGKTDLMDFFGGTLVRIICVLRFKGRLRFKSRVNGPWNGFEFFNVALGIIVDNAMKILWIN
jgi:hypothetical protein